IAVHSEADAGSLHVEMADEAHPIGRAPARESYLVGETILDVARASRADAIHPGYGFLAENAEFARAVIAAGLIWVGPHPKTIEDMGDKERARDIAKSAGVPVLPGSPRFAENDLVGLAEAAEGVGYPVLVKAAAGGGGIGMRPVRDPEALVGLVEGVQAVAKRTFGDGTVYLEHYIPRARHVEVQVFGFGDGRVVHLYERDCSIQRRFQKIVEESPAPAVPEDLRENMKAAATALSRHERYAGAGTVEFIVDPEKRAFFFLEMNTRIQVEHPVTEMVTGLDLVAMQIDLARNALPVVNQSEIRRAGHAIESRIYAENPSKNFFPSPGRLEVYRLPAESESIRIETGFRQGDEVTPHYDPLIAKVICRAATREQAIDDMLGAMEATEIRGVNTNVEFLARVLRHDAFRTGRTSTAFVEEFRAELVT
ncbi:MAG TPA: biotin carboxylase N-terminal domain-containing protein, partial [Kiloniellales bacterium]|nr:biotin carboxylase N-terminal domain-containing protein [Kiloniellales bacterium]